ncbi:hypothetical protein D6T70_06505 [Kurthia gibsonii]|uniref:hypothetical protein n=1 Tax=Kurthia gibsonii TaxID=33946 RepID=UPI000EACC314|nr:hypothetical protein [Kurthia gibsonii]RXH52484.1 hypothetical protein D6T70_06505 [Kurthia gibsonii]
MIFIKVDSVTNEVNFQHFMPFDEVNGLHKTQEELLQDGYLVDSIPDPEQINGKVPILKYNGTSLYYEYQDVPIDEITALKRQVVEQEQAIMELTALLSGGASNV